MTPLPSADAAARRRQRLRKARARAAATYADHAEVPEHIHGLLAEHLVGVRLAPALVLDLGPGSGEVAAALRRRYAGARTIHVDPVAASYAAGRRWSIRRRPWRAAAEPHQLPFASSHFDLVLANLSLSLQEDFPSTLRELARVMRPGALLAFAVLGPDSFRELRAAWARVDDHDHVPFFPDMHDIGDMLLTAGFTGVVMDSTRLGVEYPSLSALLAEIRALGITNVMPNARPGLTAPAAIVRLADHYRLTEAGKLPVSLEVACAHAWAPERAGSQSITLGARSR